MRLRVVVPSRRRRGSLRRLTAFRGAAAAALLVAALAGCGGGHHAPPPPTVPAPASPHGLAVGLTEANANLLFTDGARPAPPGFARWREALGALRPRFYRLIVDWAAVQPEPELSPDWELPANGCLRKLPPCGPFAGVRDQLRAVASRQRADGGFQVLVVLTGTPVWAATPARDCDGHLVPGESRPPAPGALAAYRRLIASLLALGREEGVALRWWSPWNEPNHPAFLSPQRAGCRAGAPSRAAAEYAPMARAMRAALAAAPGEQGLVLGELAGYVKPKPIATSVSEFVRELPRDVVCDADVFSQHEYVGGADAVGELERALALRGCPRAAPIWVTETGVGGAHAGGRRSVDSAALRAGCRELHATLLRWYEDPRVDAAFQYTFREDSVFPVGLVDPRLRRAYPTLAEWEAWGGARAPDAPPPAPAAGC